MKEAMIWDIQKQVNLYETCRITLEEIIGKGRYH